MTLRDFENLANKYIELKEENKKLKEKVKKISQWDINKDTRNSRQRVANAKILKENQELKKHLKVPKACNLKTLEDYKSYYEDTTREQILEDTYIEYCAYVNLAHRYSELKKQIEERTKMYQNAYDYGQKMEGKAIILETQQKEFIKYLEDERKRFLSNFNTDEIPIIEVELLDVVLENYKKIMGLKKWKKE